MVMIAQQSGEQSTWPISIYDSTIKWSASSSPFGIQFVTKNGGPPNCEPSDKPRYATVIFVCANDNNTNFELLGEPNLQGCATAPGYEFQLTTPYACPVSSTVSNGGGCRSCVIRSFGVFETADRQPMLSLYDQHKHECGRLSFSASYDTGRDGVGVASCEDQQKESRSGGRVVHLDASQGLYQALTEMLKLATQTDEHDKSAVLSWDATKGAQIQWRSRVVLFLPR